MSRTRKRKRGIFLSKQTLLIFSLAILSVVGVIVIVCVMPKEQEARTADICSSGPVSSATFIKTYHLRESTDGFGVFPAKDGGYLVTGDTIAGGAMAAPYPYIVKTDARGNKSWSRDYSSQSNALGALSSRHLGRLAVETTDGNIVTASDVMDFHDDKYEELKEEYGDILMTKLNAKGGQLWSILLGDYSIDRPLRMWALPDGGVILLARFMKTGYGNNIADTDAVPKYIVLIKIDKNGKTQSSNKFNWDIVDMERLADNGFIAVANINVPRAEQPENIIGPEVTMGDIPTMVRLDSNLNVVWAKSMEMIPTEINAPTSYTSSTFTMGKTKIRVPGGDFRAVQPAPDGGFLAFGFDNLMMTQGLTGGRFTPSMADLALRPFEAVKFDAAGNYQWAKKLTVNLASGGDSNDFHVVRTIDGRFVIMKDVVRDIGLIKIDADFNPVWIKKVNVERYLSGYAMRPTADNGVVVGGTMLTTKMHMVMGNLEPYKEAALIKVDANGEVSGCASVTDHPKATLEDQSQYLVSQDMNVAGAESKVMSINKKVKERIANAKNTARDICKYQKNSVTPVCSLLVSSDASTPTVPRQTVTPPVAKTWAFVNYDNAKEAAVVGEKNKAIHEELLPILNRVYNNQVKVNDSMTSMWLAYIFPRPATRADVEAVQKKYEELGYKITESESGSLWVSKIGLTLHLEFSIQNSMAGKLEVRF